MPVLSDSKRRFYDVTKGADDTCTAQCIHCRRSFALAAVSFTSPRQTLLELARALQRAAGTHRCRKAA